MNNARKRLSTEVFNSSTIGSIESEKMRAFLEMFAQGCTIEERYFFRMSVIDRPIHILILNSTEFFEYLSRDYRDNAYVIEITPDNCVPNTFGVKYHHLLSGFVESDVFGYVFDAVSPPTITLDRLGVCRDLLKISTEPLVLTYGPNDKKVSKDVLKKISAVGGMGIYEIESQRLSHILISI